jgi:hypothetical protein
MRTHTHARHSSQYLTTGNTEFPRRTISSHYMCLFWHTLYVAKHATTSDTLSIACISKRKRMRVKDFIILCTNLTVIHSSNLLHPLIDVLHWYTVKYYKIRGSGPLVPSIFFYSGAPLFFFLGDGSECEHEKTDRRRTKRGRVFDTMRIAPPHCRDFTIDLQQSWSINRKIGDRQCTYYLIVHALTVADCFFFVAATIRPQ